MLNTKFCEPVIELRHGVTNIAHIGAAIDLERRAV
jgi:hypothetical protein